MEKALIEILNRNKKNKRKEPIHYCSYNEDVWMFFSKTFIFFLDKEKLTIELDDELYGLNQLLTKAEIKKNANKFSGYFVSGQIKEQNESMKEDEKYLIFSHEGKKVYYDKKIINLFNKSDWDFATMKVESDEYNGELVMLLLMKGNKLYGAICNKLVAGGKK